MDAEEELEKAACVRTNQRVSRDTIINDFLMVAYYDAKARFCYNRHGNKPDLKPVHKLDYNMRDPKWKHRFKTAQDRDDYVINENRRRADKVDLWKARVGKRQKKARTKTYAFLMKYLHRYGVVPGRVKVNGLAGRTFKVSVFVKPDWFFTDDRCALIQGVRLYPDPNDIPGVSDGVFPAEEIPGWHMNDNRFMRKIFAKRLTTSDFDFMVRSYRGVHTVTLDWSAMSERLFIRTNLCLLARSEEGQQLPLEILQLIAIFVRSPPYLVHLTPEDRIYLPTQEVQQRVQEV